ncbi:hypothetical protein quinque_011263 [Culex quinquefasciatus]
MARLSVTILATLILYLAYQTLASEAVPTGSGNPKLLSSSVDTSENLLTVAVPNPMGYFADISLLDDEDIQKRFDDYGHMRFGKRGGEGDHFDDYGHMRFGRR